MSSETLPVTTVEFWRMRLVLAHVSGRGLHTAVYDTDPDNWNQIQNETAGILQRYVYPEMAVLDAGCAYGPVYSLLPVNVKYIGVDISPHFIEIAKLRHPEGDFHVGDISSMPEFRNKQFDVVICRSVKTMLETNEKMDVWLQALREMQRVGKRVILIGYDQQGVEEMYV